MVALGGVIVDDVEHQLDAGIVQPWYRGGEGGERVILRVALFRREIRQRVVTPVVRQLPFDQYPVVDEAVDRQQLDAGDAKGLEMLDHGRRRQAAIRAAQVWRHVFAFLRQALDVRFIDDGVFPGYVRAHFAAAPVEALVDDDGLRHAAGVVASVEREVLARAAGAIGKMRVAPYQPSGKPPGVGVEQQLVGVEAVAVLGLIRSMNAIAIKLPGRNVVQITVPDVFGALGQFDAFEFAAALRVEQAKLDLLRVGGEQCKIGSPAVPACTEACGRSRGEAHALAFRYEKYSCQGRDGEIELGYQAVQRPDFADVPDIAAAIMRGVRIENFVPLAGERHPDTVIVIYIWRKIHDH